MAGRSTGRSSTELLGRSADDAQTHAELHLAAALVHRHAGDLVAAEASLRRGIEVVAIGGAAAGVRRTAVPVARRPCCANWPRAAQASIPAAPAGRTRRSRGRAARLARRWARRYPNNLPHAARETGLIAAQRGEPRRARTFLDSSLAAAQRQGAAYEAALDPAGASPNSTRRAAWPSTCRPPGRRVAEFEFRPPAADDGATLSLTERFATLLTVGRAITAAPSHPALEIAIRDAARALLRTERCHLIPVAHATGRRSSSIAVRSDDRRPEPRARRRKRSRR